MTRARRSATHPGLQSSPRRIVFIAFDGCQALDVTGPWEVFAQARDRPARTDQAGSGPRPCYELILASPSGGDVATTSGLRLAGTLALSALTAEPIDTVVVVGGDRAAVDLVAGDPALVTWLQVTAPSARRVASVCTGAFALAAVGLLDGRRATTHWESCDRLAALYPRVKVEPDALFVSDPPIHTSAGVSAGIDLALALVESDLGRTAALAVARELVLFLRRPGGQSQFSAGLAAQVHASDRLRTLVAWMVEHPDMDLSVGALARHVGMSERNFARVFRNETGYTPAHFAELVRVDRAKVYLEDADWPLARLAARCGFGSTDGLQRAFRRQLGVTPGEYRARFASPASPQTIVPEAF